MAYNNILSVKNSNNDSSILVESDGNVVINKLVLLDDVTGRKWQIKISDGNIYAEPMDLIDKRDFKIKKILE